MTATELLIPRPEEDQGFVPAEAEASSWAPFTTTVTTLAVTAIFVVGQMYAAIPLIPTLRKEWGMSAAGGAWIVTAFGLAYAAGFLLSGPASDKFGRRRTLVAGVIATAVATAAVPCAGDLRSALVLRIVQGLAAAFFAPSALAFLAERIAPQRRMTALTTLTSSFLAAAIIAQAAAGPLLNAGGWRTVFFVSAVALVGLAFLAWRVLTGETPRPATKTTEAFTALAHQARRPVMAILYLATATVLAGFITTYTALQTADPLHLGHNPTGMLALRASALPAMVLVPLLAGRLSKWSATWRVSVGLTLAAVCAAATCVSPAGGQRVVYTGALLLFMVLGVAVATPALVEVIGAQAGQARAAATALYTFALFVGASLGPQIAALTAPHGYAIAAATAAAIFFVGALLAQVASRAN